MQAEDQNNSSNYKDTINKSKNKKLIFNYNHYEEVEKSSLAHNQKIPLNNTLIN